MKNFNEAMVAMVQSAASWRNTHTLTWIARIHSHTYINTVITTLCEAPAQLLHNLEWNCILKVPYIQDYYMLFVLYVVFSHLENEQRQIIDVSYISSPEVTLCGCRGYKTSVNNETATFFQLRPREYASSAGLSNADAFNNKITAPASNFWR